MEKTTKYCCNLCDYKTNRKSNFKAHNASARHMKLMNGDSETNEEETYYCKSCNYSTGYKYNLKLHLNTEKHKNTIEKEKEKEEEEQKKKEEEEQKKKEEEEEKQKLKQQNENNTEMILFVMEQLKNCQETNQKMMEQMNLLITNGIYNNSNNTNNTNNTTSNSHNFNLQFFLNETCKNAMNISDFVKSIEVDIPELKNMAKKGYVDGISTLILDNLKKLDITERPIHCSDAKRETIYIKEDNVWEKDCQQKERLGRVIRQISKLNTRALQDKYQKMFPTCLEDHSSKEHHEYGEIAYQAMGGRWRTEDANKKIIKKIVNDILIEKDN